VNLPLADGSFDVVFSHYVIEQMSGFEEMALNEMLRVSRMGVVMFETAVFKPTFNQWIYMKHSGYSRQLAAATSKRSDVIIEEARNMKKDRFFGAPNILFVLRKK
jgi:ubiquinone/menaquinone biosynthesis C-methylase UbiE